MKYLRYIRSFIIGAVTAYLLSRVVSNPFWWLVLFIIIAIVYTVLEELVQYLIDKKYYEKYKRK